MVLAYHATFAAYGFWLPNEERGSWSTEVWPPHLQRFGEATKTNERRSIAYRAYDRERRREMRESLLYPTVRFNQAQRDAIAIGLAEIVPKIDLRLLACAIMWDHVHLVPLRHHELIIEDIVGYLKRAATRALTHKGVHPLAEYRTTRDRIPTPWVEGGWNRYFNDWQEIVDAIGYVEGNPEKCGLAPQRFEFVENWRQFAPAGFVPKSAEQRRVDAAAKR
jgi:REP element-mobilizing transposase RayT